MGRTSGSRTVTMPVAVMPEYATGAGGPGATLHSSSFTPIANSPAYPAYAPMGHVQMQPLHILIEVEQKAARSTRNCLSCLGAGCVGCFKGIVAAAWAVVRWALSITANTMVKIAFVLALVAACYYEYLLNTGKVSGVRDPRLRQYLYGAFLDLFRSAEGQAGGGGGGRLRG